MIESAVGKAQIYPFGVTIKKYVLDNITYWQSDGITIEINELPKVGFILIPEVKNGNNIYIPKKLTKVGVNKINFHLYSIIMSNGNVTIREVDDGQILNNLQVSLIAIDDINFLVSKEIKPLFKRGYDTYFCYLPVEDQNYPKRPITYLRNHVNEWQKSTLDNLTTLKSTTHNSLYDLYGSIMVAKNFGDHVMFLVPPHIMDGDFNIILGDYNENAYITGAFAGNYLYASKINLNTYSMYIDIVDKNFNIVNTIDITSYGFVFWILGVYDLDNDGMYEIVLTGESDIAIIKEDGTLVSYTSTNRIEALPVFVDVDGDGITEIIYGDSAGMIVAMKPDGTIVYQIEAFSLSVSRILVYDINNDGILEILCSGTESVSYAGEPAKLKIYSALDGSFIREVDVPISTNLFVTNTFLIFTNNKIYFYYHAKGTGDNQGTEIGVKSIDVNTWSISGTPVIFNGVNVDNVSNPVAIDVNNDEQNEIILTTYNPNNGSTSLLVFDTNGQVLNQIDNIIPQPPKSYLYSVFFLDLDDDNIAEVILTGYERVSGTDIYYIYIMKGGV